MGASNVVIEFSKSINDYAERILNCTVATVFDNRIFFSGNKDFRNAVDPTLGDKLRGKLEKNQSQQNRCKSKAFVLIQNKNKASVKTKAFIKIL